MNGHEFAYDAAEAHPHHQHRAIYNKLSHIVGYRYGFVSYDDTSLASVFCNLVGGREENIIDKLHDGFRQSAEDCSDGVVNHLDFLPVFHNGFGFLLLDFRLRFPSSRLAFLLCQFKNLG
jgi:hypothetical protein